MKATVKMYKNDGSKNNLFPIKLIVTHQKKIKRKTIAVSSPADWNELKELPKPSHIDFEDLYGRIMAIRAEAVSTAFKSLTDLPAAIDFFLAKNSPRTENFYDFAQKQIEEMRGLNRAGNADAYQCAIDQLKKYKPQLKFSELTSYFLEGFKTEKKLTGLQNTSVRTYLAHSRAIYNKAVRLGVCEDQRPFVGLFLDLPIRKRRTKNEYLDRAGIEILQNVAGVSKEQQLAVDLSLLQFYLCGANLKDVYYLKRSKIVRNRVYLKRSKLGVKGYEFDVALLPEAKAIIEKYTGTDPVHVFPWRKGDTAYKTFRSTHNAKLKRIQKNANIEIMPVGGFLTSNIIRHSFATLAKFEHIDVDIIRELMGHERSDVDTVYKDKYPAKVRDNAQKKVVRG